MSTLAEIAEDIIQAQAAIRRQQEPAPDALTVQRDRFQDALRDLALGAQMMLEIPGESALARYAREVKRVAEAALRGNA